MTTGTLIDHDCLQYPTVFRSRVFRREQIAALIDWRGEQIILSLDWDGTIAHAHRIPPPGEKRTLIWFSNDATPAF